MEQYSVECLVDNKPNNHMFTFYPGEVCVDNAVAYILSELFKVLLVNKFKSCEIDLKLKVAHLSGGAEGVEPYTFPIPFDKMLKNIPEVFMEMQKHLTELINTAISLHNKDQMESIQIDQ